jgi:hypothetical protein
LERDEAGLELVAPLRDDAAALGDLRQPRLE